MRTAATKASRLWGPMPFLASCGGGATLEQLWVVSTLEVFGLERRSRCSYRAELLPYSASLRIAATHRLEVNCVQVRFTSSQRRLILHFDFDTLVLTEFSGLQAGIIVIGGKSLLQGVPTSSPCWMRLFLRFSNTLGMLNSAESLEAKQKQSLIGIGIVLCNGGKPFLVSWQKW